MTTQRQRVATLFQAHPHTWIPLPTILGMGVAQYGARILELRRAGMEIENKTRIVAGVKHSWFRYTPGQKEFDFS